MERDGTQVARTGWRPRRAGEEPRQRRGGRAHGHRCWPRRAATEDRSAAPQGERDAAFLPPGGPSGGLSTGVQTPARTAPAAASDTAQRKRPDAHPQANGQTAGCHRSPRRDKCRHPPARGQPWKHGGRVF